nr:multidrug effflux MFS transporter [Zoogloeaceae bacterium]
MPASSPRLSFLLAGLAAIGPFAIDTYLPAFHAMAAALSASQLEVQQTLTIYMATFAAMALWHGALSDRFGRRKVIIVATALFALASLVCAAARSIEWLWLGRGLQGLAGGAGMIVGRAVIRDVFDGAQAQRAMSRVMMIFGIAPAVAPMVGGALLALAGWRSIFVFLALFAAVLTWLTWRFLPETLAPEARHSLHPVKLGRAYLKVVASVAFLLLVGATAMNFNGFFIYVLSAPVFLMDHLGLAETQFAWLFIPAVAGLTFGSMLSGRAAGRWSARRTIHAGFAIMLVAAAINIGHASLMAPGLPWSVLPVALYNCGMALAMPSLTLLALDLFPDRRGLASSCQSFAQVGTNAVTAGLVAPLLWGSPLSLAIGMALFMLGGLALFIVWGRRAA